jgi:ferredoxin-NADP reductase
LVVSEGELPVGEQDLDLVVVSKQTAADGVVVLTLADATGGELPSWAPGAHIDVVLENGLVRQYSLSGAPSDRSYWRIGVLREPQSRGGSEFVHDQLEPGATVRARGPRNHFQQADADSYIFIAGGIGITPLLPMIAHADAAGANWRLVYGGRTRASMAFTQELESYGNQVQLCPQDETGLLDLEGLLGTPLADTLVYCCGPGPLLDAVENKCADAWPTGALRVERFAAKPSTGPAPDVTDTSFEVTLARSGVTLEVPADQSILDVIEDAGISVLASCCEGICGTCETVVLDGIPDHRDSVLSDEEHAANDVMMICVSRCAGDRLTLDV